MPGDALPELPDRLGEDVGAAVGQVVAGDARDDDVLQAQSGDRLGDAARLVIVEPGRAARLDVAEAAGAGAGVAQDHDRGGALVPALPDVRAVGLLADGVEVQAAEQPLEVVVVLARRQLRLDPVGVAPQRRRAVGRREADEPAAAHGDRDRLGGRVAAAVGLEDREVALHGTSLIRLAARTMERHRTLLEAWRIVAARDR